MPDWTQGPGETADKISVIQLTTGKMIRVSGGVDEVVTELAERFHPGGPPFVKVKDPDGGVCLINVNEIASIEGPE